jgi:bacterioferritin (cytochrome b1)
MRLSNQWLESNPAGTLEDLFRSLSEEMKLRMVGRLRWISHSDKVSNFGRVLLSEALPDEATLDSEFGSKLLDRFVHLVPDATMEHMDRLLSGKTVDELVAFETGRRNTIWALEKLVFRHETFDSAARLLLKLGAAENENYLNNASGQFTGLYQLYLSGTEATPEEKLVVLDDGLAHADERVRKLCVDALDRMLETWHFSRSGGSEHIGAGEALQDWQPTIYGEIFDYYRAALSRLERIAVDSNDPNRQTALSTIGSHLRRLFSNVNLLDEIQAMIARLREAYPGWQKAALGVNDWLYFDRNDADEEYQQRLRAYYDELLPTEPLELIHYYSSGWATDIHDPDVSYDREGDNDHHYGENKIYELVDAAPKEAAYFLPLLERFLEKPTNSGWIAVVHIAKHVSDPEYLLGYLLESVTADSEMSVVSNLVRNIISGAAQTDRNKGMECLELALGAPSVGASSIEFLTSVGLDDTLMRRAIEYVQNDTVEPHQVSVIAFNDVLQTIDEGLIELLVRTLLTKQTYGAWAAVDFLNHVLHRSDPKVGKLLQSFKESVTNHALFDKPRYSNMDWYHWCDLVEKLLNGGHVDDSFSAELVDFIISVTSVEEYGVQLAFDDYAQKILRRIISDSPCLVWEKYHEALASADGQAVYRLSSLFGTGVGEPSNPGVLNDVPAEIYVPWMLQDKEERMPFILDWLQLFVGGKNDRQWNADFVSFVDAHVDCPERLNTLRSRLTTGSWWGSFSNKLEAERDQLIQLREASSNFNAHRWIDRTVSQMEQQIVEERRQEANREASYKA